MSRFFQKAIERLNRLDPMQAGTLLRGLAGENDLLAMVLESMTDGIIVLDEVHAIRSINKAAERLLPFAADELTGRAVWQVVDDEQVAAFLRDTLIGSDRVLDGEFTLEWAPMRRRWRSPSCPWCATATSKAAWCTWTTSPSAVRRRHGCAGPRAWRR